MFAIIKSGGKQYRVQQEQTIAVEKLPGEVGAQVALRDVLMLGSGDAEGVTVAGEPLIADACVHAEIIKQDRLPKIRVFKKKRRKKYKRTLGHRQQMTWLRIDGIEAPKELFPELSAGRPAKKVATKTAAKTTPKAEPKASVAKTTATKKTAAETKTPAPEQKPDKLTELPGVGEATEKKLHKAGIKYYEDIIRPGDAILAEIEKEPALAKIIKNEDVVKAAKTLAKNKDKKE
ncbi:MAG: 50S ribosomal protein L21 [Hyphomicrobiales bacterium]|nr:50S ribosomal protein L21 [Hyphomicrobiales bacterium]